MNRQRHRDRVDAVNARLNCDLTLTRSSVPVFLERPLPDGMTRAEFVKKIVDEAGPMMAAPDPPVIQPVKAGRLHGEVDGLSFPALEPRRESPPYAPYD